MYEERYVVIEGSGSTEVWKEGSSARSSFEWHPWSAFSIPLNAWFRIENTGTSPAILVAANAAPRVMNMFANKEFIFDNPFVFNDRFGGNLEDYWRPNEEIEPQPVRGRAMVTSNLIPDVAKIYLPLDNNRGPGPPLAGAEYDRQYPPPGLDRPVSERALCESARARGRSCAPLPGRQRVQHDLAQRHRRRHALGRRQGRPGQDPGLRAWRSDQRGARALQLVPSALRVRQGSDALLPLHRPRAGLGRRSHRPH